MPKRPHAHAVTTDISCLSRRFANVHNQFGQTMHNLKHLRAGAPGQQLILWVQLADYFAEMPLTLTSVLIVAFVRPMNSPTA